MSIFKLTLPGFNVDNSHVDEDVINSLYPNPKINTKADPPHAGIIFVDWASSITIADGVKRILHSFPHNYNYVPTVFATYSFDNGSQKLNGVLPFGYGALGAIVIDATRTDIRLLYISFDESFPLTTIPPFIMQVRFYVMAERGRE